MVDVWLCSTNISIYCRCVQCICHIGCRIVYQARKTIKQRTIQLVLFHCSMVLLTTDWQRKLAIAVCSEKKKNSTHHTSGAGLVLWCPPPLYSTSWPRHWDQRDHHPDSSAAAGQVYLCKMTKTLYCLRGASCAPKTFSGAGDIVSTSSLFSWKQ